MTTKTVRLDEDVYAAIKAQKREDESFSEAIERLIDPPPLRELAGILSDEEAEEWLDAIEESRQADIESEGDLWEDVESR